MAQQEKFQMKCAYSILSAIYGELSSNKVLDIQYNN